MNKTNFWTLLVCVLSLSSCTPSVEQQLEKLEKEREEFKKKVATIKDDSLRQSAKEFGLMLFWFKEIELQNQQPPKDTAYQENPFLVVDSYPSTDALVNSYLNATIVERNSDAMMKAELKIRYPFALPFQQTATWKDVSFSNGTSIAIKPEAEENMNAMQVVKTNWNGIAGMDIYYPEHVDANAVRPVSVSGNIEALVPKNILQFKFKASEKGDTKTQNGISVKLTEAKGHVAAVEVTNPNKTDPAVNTDEMKLVTIMALDQTKQYLYQNGSASGPDDLTDYYYKILDKIMAKPDQVKELEKEVRDEEKKHEEKYKNKMNYKAYFKGTPTDFVVYVLDYSKATKINRAMKLKAYSFGNVSNEAIADIPLPVTVYDSELPAVLSRKTELSEAELKSIAIPQKAYEKKTDPPMYEQKAQFSFQYPEMMSGLFVSSFDRFGTLKELSFYERKGGKKISLPKDSLDLSDDYFEGPGEPWVEYQVNRIEYNPTKFPAAPKFAKGVIEIKLMEVKKKQYNAAKLPAGLTISGNQLILDKSVTGNSNRYYAKDKTGKYLKELTTIVYSKGDGYDAKKTEVHYFYGSPAQIESYEAGADKMVNHPFEVELVSHQPTP